MEIVLLEDVKALGKKGQVVKVNDGYARNFILPKKLGVEATSKRGWSGYHTYIRIYFLIEKIEFISGIERKSLRNNSLFVCQVTFKIKIMGQLLKEYIAE